MDFITAKFQFEIRYTPILNFQSIYRELLAPYIKLSSGFRINNKNQDSEYITIVFEEEGVHIDCRWDRLILLTQGDHQSIIDPDGLSKIYFEIFEKLKTNDSFGIINNYIAVASGVTTHKQSDIKLEQVKKNFIEYYFQNSISKRLESKNQPDPAIIFDFVDNDGNDNNLSIGPYDYDKDFKKRNLAPYNSEKFESLKSNYGYMVEYKITSTDSRVDLTTISSFFKKLDSFYDIYSEDLKQIFNYE